MRGLLTIIGLLLWVCACRDIPPFPEDGPEQEDAGTDTVVESEPDVVPDLDDVEDGCGITPRCEGEALIVCEGQVERRTSCEEGTECLEGACEPVGCVPGSATCEGDDVLSCPIEGGEAVRIVCNDETSCQMSEFGCGCRQGQCTQRVCEPGTSACVEGGVQSCPDDGLMLNLDACGEGEVCFEGGCAELVCQPGATRCDGNILRVCTDGGTYEQMLNCSGNRFCNDTPSPHCEERFCRPNTSRCSEDRLSLLICDERGGAESRQACVQGQFCEDAACRVQLCEPDTIFCDGGDVHLCDSVGSGSTVQEDCPQGVRICVDGACRNIICEGGSAECNGEVLSLCNDTGTEEIRDDCLRLGSYCDLQQQSCVEWVCEPGTEPECFEGGVRVCDDRGTGFVIQESCDNRGCEDGVCVRLVDGEACEEGNDCESSNCSQGVCTPEAFAFVPSGTFTMGSPGDEPGRSAQEGPQREVTIGRDLWVMRTEVTQRQWSTLMRNNPSVHRGDTLRPVDSVSWYGALAFANARSRDEGLTECYDLGACTGTPGGGDFECPETLGFSLECRGYRLPTEAEWEAFARGGTDTAFPTGGITSTDCSDEPNLIPLGWYCGNAGGTSHSVGEKAPNPYGLFDTAGNVFEWVWDWFDSDYYEDAPDEDPLGPESGTNRVMRGGGWNFQARGARSAFRLSQAPAVRQGFLGFRLVRRPPQ